MKTAFELLPLLDAAGAWLSTYLLHSTALLVAALLLGRWLGSRHLAVEESLLRVAVVGGLLTATFQSGLGVESAVGSIAYPAAAPVFSSGAVEGEVLRASAEEVVATSAPRSTASAQVPLTTLETAPTADATAFSWLGVGVLVWGFGAVLLTGRLLLLAFSLSRRLRERVDIERGPLFRLLWRLLASADVDRETRLTRTDRLAVPIAIGVGRREICLPERVVCELPREQQETVLAHELAHLERRDPAWLLVVRLVESVLFVQPLNRLARRRLQELAEYGCDDWAARHTGRPDTLARCLTEVASWSVEEPRLALTPTMAAGSGLGRRVRRLLAPEYVGSEARVPGWSRPLAAAALIAVVLVVPGFSVLGQEPPAEPPPPESAELVAPATSPPPETGPAAPVDAPVPVVVAVPAPAVSASPAPAPEADVVAVGEVRVAPRIVRRLERRHVVRIAPEAVARVSAASDRDHDHDHDVEHELGLSEEEVELLEEEIEQALDVLDETLERDLEATLEGLEDQLDGMEEALEEGLELEIERFEEAIEREVELMESQLERLEEELERDHDRREQELNEAEAEALSRRREDLEHELERVEEEMEVVAEQLEDELDRIEDRLDERLERRFESGVGGELEVRIEAVNERLEVESERLEALAHELAHRHAIEGHAVEGGPHLTEEDRERLRAQARRIAEQARPSEEELEALRESVRALAVSLQPTSAELEEMRRELAEELGALEVELRRAFTETRRAVEALREEGRNR